MISDVEALKAAILDRFGMLMTGDEVASVNKIIDSFTAEADLVRREDALDKFRGDEPITNYLAYQRIRMLPAWDGKDESDDTTRD